MSKFHTTVSRRNFMKGLGLGAAGLGAAGLGTSAAVAPVFHDIDDLSSSPNANWKHPWWVKEKDIKDPSIDVDWGTLEHWNWGASEAHFRGGTGVLGHEARNQHDRDGLEYFAAGRKRSSDFNNLGLRLGTPGYALRDTALGAAAGAHRASESAYVWDHGRVSTPDPRWTGTPEEATNMVRAAAHFLGAYKIGVVEIDSDIKKLFQPTGVRFEDIDEGYEDLSVPLSNGYSHFPMKVVPNKARYYIDIQMRQPVEMTKRGNSRQQVGASVRYANDTHIFARIARFIKGIGYQAYADVYGTGGFAWGKANVAVASLSGTGEISRIGHIITHEVGPAGVYNQGMITDLPLAPTKPIDAGMFRFCRLCKTCATTCDEINGWTPISLETEPTYDTTGPWNRVGKKVYPMDWTRCLFCPYCQGSCPFSNHGTSASHELVKLVQATTGIFNGFLADMQVVMGYGLHDDSVGSIPKVGDPMPTTIELSSNYFASWWTRNLNTWKHDDTWGVG